MNAKQHYRPKLFQEVVGQDAIVQTLKNSIKKNRLANAYLFSGSHGTGKTTLARLFAKALNCKNLSTEYEPCNQCTHCHEIDHAISIDVLEIDGASHRGIEDIRKINETCAFLPTSCRYKIYLIDEVHMLTKEAFNALLKTLEEPPPNVKFFFATTEAHKMLPTILSRCQRYNLKRITPEKIVEKLTLLARTLAIEVDPAALFLIARYAKGGMRDAESLFDQLIIFGEGTITKQVVYNLLGITSRELFFTLDKAQDEENLGAIFSIASEIIDTGKSPLYFLSELTDHFRTLLLLKAGSTPLFYDEEEKRGYQIHAPLYDQNQLITILQSLQEAESSFSLALSDKIWLEGVLLRIVQSKRKISVESLVDKLLLLEKKLKTAPSSSPPPQPSTPIKEAVAAPPSPPVESEKKKSTSLKEQSRYDTVMRFAAKELNGSLKKE